ncbi:MAG: nitroreductase family protein [Geobacteraceae bacterium]
METHEAIRTWRSTRKFSDRPVEKEKVAVILESVRRSPSWANMQCWKLIVVTDEDTRRSLSDLTFVESVFGSLGYTCNPAQKGVAQAPVVIVLCADPARSGSIWNQDFYLTDAGIAAQNLMLATHDQGLGTVFIGIFDEEAVRSLLLIPPDQRVVGLFPVGYPLSTRETTQRKELAEIVCYEKWS